MPPSPNVSLYLYLLLINKGNFRPEMAMFVKKLYIGVGREVREGSFQIITTIIFCFSLAFFIVILSMFINDQFKKNSVYDDLYYPNYNAYSSSSSEYDNSSSADKWKYLIGPKDLWHSMTDEELLWKASMVPQISEYPYNRTPKVAFLFLSRGRLPLGPLWEMFFKGHENLFSIYLHTSPDFNSEPPQSSVFYKRRVPSKVSLLLFCLSHH